ncbi:Tetratricopeptide repeat family [Mycena sanguinolenta]|uniref:Tetratricopeptide repeat family n=1 Tax=Mycena sanguinolenta TaxID=230812 RepID=A0A8H6XUD1_9AGAR|nr:Tetratricopeptide repeat family [Mycena sanguinolenta]
MGAHHGVDESRYSQLGSDLRCIGPGQRGRQQAVISPNEVNNQLQDISIATEELYTLYRMDPITATTTIITLATFIKDLIEVGQNIQRSIEMVSENRRRIRDLTNDIVRTLVEIANLTRGKEDTFQAPALLSALGNLKQDMLYVLSACNRIAPSERPGFRGFRSQIKAWMKREDIEAEIRRLKEHVNKCHVQFTAISVARIERSTTRIEDIALDSINTHLRVEQRLIGHHVENRAMLQRVQGMMAQVLIETSYGQNVMTRTAQVISSDPSHRKLESRYFAIETMRLIESLQQLVVTGKLVLDLPQWNHAAPFSLVLFRPKPIRHILHSVLGLILEISTTSTLSVQSLLSLELGQNLRSLRMYPEAVALEGLVTQILRQAIVIGHGEGGLAELAFSFDVLSRAHEDQLQYNLAARASKQSLELWRRVSIIFPDIDNSQGHLASSLSHARHLFEAGQLVAAIAVAEEAVALTSTILKRLVVSDALWTDSDIHKAVTCRATYFLLAKSPLGGWATHRGL